MKNIFKNIFEEIFRFKTKTMLFTCFVLGIALFNSKLKKTVSHSLNKLQISIYGKLYLRIEYAIVLMMQLFTF